FEISSDAESSDTESEIETNSAAAEEVAVKEVGQPQPRRNKLREAAASNKVFSLFKFKRPGFATSILRSRVQEISSFSFKWSTDTASP
ncbi:hypothetical protein EST38_g14628, partial [Candolleomyces aberdarensis]